MKDEKPTERRAFRLPLKLDKRIVRESKRRQWTPSHIIRDAVGLGIGLLERRR